MPNDAISSHVQSHLLLTPLARHIRVNYTALRLLFLPVCLSSFIGIRKTVSLSALEKNRAGMESTVFIMLCLPGLSFSPLCLSPLLSPLRPEHCEEKPLTEALCSSTAERGMSRSRWQINARGNPIGKVAYIQCLNPLMTPSPQPRSETRRR